MNDTDFETRLARALNVGVDERLGAERPAPPFRVDNPTRTLTRPYPRWNRLLLAAACVLAVIAGAIASVHSAGDRDRRQLPATQTPAPTTTTSRRAPTTHSVTVGGARLVLPLSWNATRLPNVSPPTWCLAPQGSSTSEADCPTTFRRIDRVNAIYPIDVDSDGGGGGEVAQYCAPQAAKWDARYDVRTLGGRSAQWRAFTITCPDGSTRRHEQYVVDTLPAFALTTEHDYGNIATVIERIAAQSALPAPTGPLALADHGVVRKVTVTADGARIRLQRVVRPEPGGATVAPAPGAPALPIVTYDIPQLIYAGLRTSLTVGAAFDVFTDGTRVVSMDAA